MNFLPKTYFPLDLFLEKSYLFILMDFPMIFLIDFPFLENFFLLAFESIEKYF